MVRLQVFINQYEGNDRSRELGILKVYCEPTFNDQNLSSYRAAYSHFMNFHAGSA